MKASREALIKYWTLQGYLSYCHDRCKFKGSQCSVWGYDDGSYDKQMVFTCHHENMRKAFELLIKMSNSKPLGYFIVSLEEYWEIRHDVEKRLGEKVIVLVTSKRVMMSNAYRT